MPSIAPGDELAHAHRVVARPGVDASPRRGSARSASASTVGPTGWRPRWPRRQRASSIVVARSTPYVSHAVGNPARAAGSGRRVSKRNDEMQPPSVGSRRGEQRRRHRRRRLGRRVEVGFGRIVLDLDVDEHPAHASSASPSVGTCVGQVDAAGVATIARPSAETGVVMDHEGAVGGAPDVELDAVGAACGPPCSKASTVFSALGARRAAVGDDVRSRGRTRNPCHRANAVDLTSVHSASRSLDEAARPLHRP